MTNTDDALSEVKDIADQVMSNKNCEDAKADFDKLAADATKSIKDNAQKLVDTYCKSGADQERIRDTKEKSQRLNKASKLGLHG